MTVTNGTDSFETYENPFPPEPSSSTDDEE